MYAIKLFIKIKITKHKSIHQVVTKYNTDFKYFIILVEEGPNFILWALFSYNKIKIINYRTFLYVFRDVVLHTINFKKTKIYYKKKHIYQKQVITSVSILSKFKSAKTIVDSCSLRSPKSLPF